MRVCLYPSDTYKHPTRLNSCVLVLLKEAEPRTCMPKCMLSVVVATCFCLTQLYTNKETNLCSQNHMNRLMFAVSGLFVWCSTQKRNYFFFFFKLGKVDYLELSPASMTLSCFTLGTQILSLSASLGIIGQERAKPLFCLHIL